MFLDDGQKLERHAARFLGACLPFFDGRFTCIEIAGKNGLAYMLALTNFLDLTRLDWGRSQKTSFIEFTHGGLVDCPSAIHAGYAAVDRLEGVALVLTIRCHGISPIAL